MFTLGDLAEKEARRSLSGLIARISKEKGQHHDAIFVVINSKITLLRTKDYTPRIIPIPHALDKLDNKSILLITKDPSTPYRVPLTEENSPCEDVFNQIYSLKKVKQIARDPKKLYKLYKEFDLVVADDRIHKQLPDILKAQFYEKNKKVPYMIQLAKPTPQLKQKGVRPEEKCEPKYVKAQMKSIVKNTSFIAPANGTCLSIKIGFSDWEVTKLVENMNLIIDYLTNEKFQPVGGVLRNVNNISNVHVKTGESISLPVMAAQTEEESDQDYSDYDF